MSRAPACHSQERVSSSGAISPTCAPSSALMLASVMRSLIDNADTASPQYSIAW